MLTLKTIVSRASPSRNRAIIMTNMVKSTLSKSAASNCVGKTENIEKPEVYRSVSAAEFHSNASDVESTQQISEKEQYTEQSKLIPTENPIEMAERLFLEKKMATHNALTQDLSLKSFSSDEEKYQSKTSEIIEIFYEMDEDKRPKELKALDIDYMVKMKRPNSIKNFIKRLAKQEKNRKEIEKMKADIKESIASSPKPKFGINYDDDGKPVYKVHCVSQSCSWSASKRIREHQYARIARAKLLDAQKVVIDFSYDNEMTLKQHVTITSQIKIAIGILKRLPEPIDLYFCNFKSDSPAARFLELEFGPPSTYLVNATPKSYVEVFPKERLVYLTADTENVLQYDPDDIYIIGGMIDAQTNEPVAARKAANEGLRTAKLPLGNHELKNEFKSLKISQVFGIIAQISSSSCDLDKALQKFISFRLTSKTDKDYSISNKFKLDYEKTKQHLLKKYALSDEEADAMMLLALYYRQ